MSTKLSGWTSAAGPARRREGRLQGRLGEEVEDVHQDQLLMLFLVRKAEVDEIGEVRRIPGQQRRHAGVHVRTVGDDVGERRTGQQAALGPRLTGGRAPHSRN
ncbi:hypothetical protein [Phenylobacterium sp. J367]|uniref:hypothetical protein n=1 Tax=Phenylobacterium sp. J367 TaxID=2898435 RepID=UPI002150B728|nr:hypothetical protein [Phenylobacterium sp. J367]MCR5880647.1 hypothetical protein [Phenylobacterium sp. J367]